MLARRGNDCPKAKRESGANGSRTRGFMLAPPYDQVTEMQGGGGGWFARGWSFAADGAMIFHAKAQRGFSRVVAPDSIDRKSTRLNSRHQCASRMPSSA